MRTLLAGLLLLTFAVPESLAQKWGGIEGQIVIRKRDGDKVPKLKPRIKKGQSVKDAEVCALADVPNLKLLVDPSTLGIKNVFVYVLKVDAIHPNMKAVPKKPVVLDQKGCVFSPHALFLRTGQDLLATTKDNCAHNLRDTPFDNKGFNITIPPKAKPLKFAGSKYFNTQEKYPFTFECDFHKWMKAYAIVLDHPYCAITDEKGKFKIENLPAGNHELIIWHEAAGALEKKFKIKVVAGKITELEPYEAKIKDFLGKDGVTKDEIAE